MFRSIILALLLTTFLMKTHAQTNSALDTVQMKNKSSIIADGAQLQLVSDQFGFTEGPATDKDGNIFFTDQPNNRIWKYDTEGKLSVFLEKAGRSNGTYFDKQGNLVTCADERNELWSITPTGKITVLLKDVNGLHLNGPNDLWIHPNSGGIYFTDPYYQRDYWTHKSPQIEGQKVYYLPTGKAPIVVADNLVKPNGIIGTPDGKYLYVADIEGNKTYKYTIAADGTLTQQTLHVPMGSDGMTLDNQGNIYLTGKGVTVFDPEGKQIEHIDIPDGWTGNVTFGGKQKDLLFITASKAVYTLKMKVTVME
jgi:gluconolactonase